MPLSGQCRYDFAPSAGGIYFRTEISESRDEVFAVRTADWFFDVTSPDRVRGERSDSPHGGHRDTFRQRCGKRHRRAIVIAGGDNDDDSGGERPIDRRLGQIVLGSAAEAHIDD